MYKYIHIYQNIHIHISGTPLQRLRASTILLLPKVKKIYSLGAWFSPYSFDLLFRCLTLSPPPDLSASLSRSPFPFNPLSLSHVCVYACSWVCVFVRVCMCVWVCSYEWVCAGGNLKRIDTNFVFNSKSGDELRRMPTNATIQVCVQTQMWSRCWRALRVVERSECVLPMSPWKTKRNRGMGEVSTVSMMGMNIIHIVYIHTYIHVNTYIYMHIHLYTHVQIDTYAYFMWIFHTYHPVVQPLNGHIPRHHPALAGANIFCKKIKEKYTPCVSRRAYLLTNLLECQMTPVFFPHAYEGVTFFFSTHTNESLFYMNEWVMESSSTNLVEHRMKVACFPRMNAIPTWVMAHVRMSHGTHTSE